MGAYHHTIPYHTIPPPPSSHLHPIQNVGFVLHACAYVLELKEQASAHNLHSYAPPLPSLIPPPPSLPARNLPPADSHLLLLALVSQLPVSPPSSSGHPSSSLFVTKRVSQILWEMKELIRVHVHCALCNVQYVMCSVAVLEQGSLRLLHELHALRELPSVSLIML